MRRISLILLLLGMLLAVGIVGAQEEEFFISYRISDTIQDDEQNLSQEFVENIQKRLLGFDVRIASIANPEPTDDYTSFVAVLRFDERYHR